MVSIQPFWGHIHHVKLGTDNTANMQKAFRNDLKPVTQDVDQLFYSVMSDVIVDYTVL